MKHGEANTRHGGGGTNRLAGSANLRNGTFIIFFMARFQYTNDFLGVLLFVYESLNRNHDISFYTYIIIYMYIYIYMYIISSMLASEFVLFPEVVVSFAKELAAKVQQQERRLGE